MPDPIHDPSQNDPAGRPRALPQVWLVASSGEVLVAPAGPATPAFDPFPLPPVPKSLSDWLAILCEDFWREHRRCLGTVLLLEPHKRAWRPAIPAQRCARDAACWSLRRDDLPAPELEVVLAGSFQTRVLAAGEDPAAAPPPHDGVHLVLDIGPSGRASTIRSFLRAGGQTRQVSPEAIMFDDWKEALAHAMPRIKLV
jgi:hypothetical protein